MNKTRLKMRVIQVLLEQTAEAHRQACEAIEYSRYMTTNGVDNMCQKAFISMSDTLMLLDEMGVMDDLGWKRNDLH